MSYGVLKTAIILLMIIQLYLYTIPYTIEASSSDNNIVYVPRDYPDLQAAIDNVEPGTTIVLEEGVYYSQYFIINKRDLRIVGKGDVIIRSSSILTGLVGIFIRDSENIVLENIKFTENPWPIYFVRVRNTSIVNCTIYGNTISILIEDSQNITIYRNYIENSYSNGIKIKRSSNISIIKNTIIRSSYSDIDIERSENITIVNNTIVGEISRIPGIHIVDTVNTLISNNKLIKKSIFIEGDRSFKTLKIINSSVNNKPIVYLKDSDYSWNTIGNVLDIGMAILYNVSRLSIENYLFSDTSVAIEAWNCRELLFRNNTFHRIYSSIYLYSCVDIALTKNTYIEDRLSITVFKSSSISIEESVFNGNKWISAIILESNNILVLNNTFKYIEDTGVIVVNSDLVEIYNNFIGFSKGIYIEASANVIISFNTLASSSIELVSSKAIVIENTFFKGGIIIRDEWSVKKLFLKRNTVNGKPILFIRDIDLNNKVIDKHYSIPGQIIVYNVSNLLVKDLVLEETSIAITLINVVNASLSKMLLNNNLLGIYVIGSKNISISKTTISYSSHGVDLRYSLDITITFNLFYRNNLSLSTASCENVSIYGNSFIDNDIDVSSRDDLVYNSPYKLYYILNGTIHYSYVGNYWSKNVFSEDINGDGLCDRVYSSSGIPDYYPLVYPHKNYYFTSTKPCIIVYYPVNKSFVSKSITIHGYSNIELTISIEVYDNSLLMLLSNKTCSVYGKWSINLSVNYLNEGVYRLHIVIYINDIVYNDTWFIVFIDNNPPRVGILYPFNNSIVVGDFILKFSVYDRFLNNTIVILKNSTVEYIFFSKNNSLFINTSLLDNGVYYLCVIGIDAVGHNGSNCIQFILVKNLSKTTTPMPVFREYMLYVYIVFFVIASTMIYYILKYRRHGIK